jgi:CHAT domain-containing protein
MDLPAAQVEAQSIRDLFSDLSDLFVRRGATETLLKETAASYSHIHIASHGQFAGDAPLSSKILLAKDEKNDGALTVDEVYGLTLNAELIVLSACETGLGTVNRGDDVVGMMRGFLHSGARKVVGTLWEVDDEATAQIMRHFYQLLKQGVPAEQALAKAQLLMAGKKQHPFFWAAFSIVAW